MPLRRQELETALAHLERGDWQAAHEIAQKDERSAPACWAHGIFPERPSAAQELAALKRETGL